MSETPGTRTVNLGQFRLVRLQVVNWGLFCDYKDFPIDERGVFFTGPSGSGKSSLLDGHSVALLPTLYQKFNASSDLAAKGAKQSTRSAADYVRGAWSENDDEHGESQVRYLRAGKPTWSAIGATYDNGLGSITSGIVIKWFKGTENDGGSLQTMHLLHDGHFDLTALNGWASGQRQAFDLRWLKATFPPSTTTYPSGEADYIRALGKRIGLGTSKTALSLLGRAKAMKNVGDLNLFIRDNMLDEPETFAAANTMIGLFNPLNEAYETARRAHEQEKVLRPIPEHWASYCEAKTESNLAAILQGTAMDQYLRGVYLRLVADEITRLGQEIETLDQQLTRQTKQEEDAKVVYRSLDEQLRREGKELTDLENELDRAKERVETRTQAHALFSAHVERLGVEVPIDLQSFTVLKARIPELLRTYLDEQATLKPQRAEAFGAQMKARDQLRERTAELEALQTAKSLIPSRETQRRQAIAEGARIPVNDLAYAAELIDIAEGQERWRGAAEKVLRNFGLRLLVPDRHKDAVKTFIDEHNMAGIVEYSIVTGTSAHQPRPAPQTLAEKLRIDIDHPAGPWLAGQVARQFEHVCVETTRDLEGHPLAVTVRGTVKMRGNHYRKDDRSEVTQRSAYILGTNPATKIAALEVEVAALKKAADQAGTEADALDEQWQCIKTAADAADQLTGYDTWADLDPWTAASTVEDLRRRIEQIETSNVNLRLLREQCDQAEVTWKKWVGLCAETKKAIDGQETRITELNDDHAREVVKPHQVDDGIHHSYLDEVYASLDQSASVDRMPELRQAFARDLDQRRRQAEAAQRISATTVKNAIEWFLREWPGSAPDDSGDLDRCGAAFAALHDEIASRQLPEAMAKFQTMISEDMVPSVNVLYRTVETSAADIRARIKMVNKGLQRVEFNPGTHLQISFNPKRFTAGIEFRKVVDDLNRHTAAAGRGGASPLVQFRRVRDLMARFTATDPESKRWREEVLDVRLSFVFYGREEDPDQTTTKTYRNTSSGSGGEQEKLVAFCLAAALSYNLADKDSGGRPRYAPLMLDEAFSKSDEMFASQALAAFDEFGFQLIIAAPIRMSGILEPFIGQAILVEKRFAPDGAHAHAASATFGELAIRQAAETDGASDAAA